MSESLAIYLGLIQGVAEFLPISSSAHLLIASRLMAGKELPLGLNAALHLGTLGAVVVYFWRDWWQMLRPEAGRLDPLLGKLVIASLPAATLGLVAKDAIAAHLHQVLWVIAPLGLVGVLMWACDRYASVRLKLADLKWRHAWWIGCAQACALVPGVSRSGATLSCARALGLSRAEAARFSFLLGTPAMAGAALLLAPELMSQYANPSFWSGVGAALAAGLVSIGVLLRVIDRIGLGPFALYRVVLSAVLAKWFVLG